MRALKAADPKTRAPAADKQLREAIDILTSELQELSAENGDPRAMAAVAVLLKKACALLAKRYETG